MKRFFLLFAALVVLLLPVGSCKKHQYSPETNTSGGTDNPGGSDTPLRPGDGVTPVPDAVDLGMIVNGKNVKWASFNLGASSPEQSGLFLAWGDLEEDKPGYQIPLGASVTLPDDHDAAIVKLGGKWRMPLKEELEALYTECDIEWDMIGTVKGMRFSSKKNSNSIFLPAGGWKNGVNHYGINTNGCYWSSNVDPADYPHAFYLTFNVGNHGYMVTSGNYSDGHMIRPVQTD